MWYFLIVFYRIRTLEVFLMDFYKIRTTALKKNKIEIYPEFLVGRSKDLMTRGKSFYAIWNENSGMWSTDEYDVQKIVDESLWLANKKLNTQEEVIIKPLSDFSNKMWNSFKLLISNLPDNYTQLDSKVTFLNTQVKKSDYVSKRVPYSLEAGKCLAFDKIMSTLYEPQERHKLEWAIGSIIAGDSIDLQKFIVLYGAPGSGKSTVLNIISKLFEGYCMFFEAKVLTSQNNAFSTEAFKNDALVGIDHEADLSKIEDNTRLNSIVSHETMRINEKNKPTYTARINCLLFMGTNNPIKITDAKSGIIRRMIDVRPSGNTLSKDVYLELVNQVDYELGAIAAHCLEVYKKRGKNYYDTYRSVDMMLQTDIFFNFVESSIPVFNEQSGVRLQQAYTMYKEYCEDSMLTFRLPKHKFREELKNYFKEFHDLIRIDGVQVRSWYTGFLNDKFETPTMQTGQKETLGMDEVWKLDQTKSWLDEWLKDRPAQYASDKEKPINKWAKVTTTLSDINTKEVHYVKPELNHIVIDFDLKDEQGNKSIDRNLEAIRDWIPTYAEFSKSGSGIHLHYIYSGDVNRLSRIHSEGIEVKVFTGDGSLRRKLTFCNDSHIETISSGLSLKGDAMINFESVKSEKVMRGLILKNLRKEIHAGTKPSIDFIDKILSDAYKNGLRYDVTDMRPKILAFATNSTNQSEYCIKTVCYMKFKSEEAPPIDIKYDEEEYVFFDVEMFPNLFVVCWKRAGENQEVVKMINPTATDIESILKFKLIGFNCRRYDNHMLYARYIGYDIPRLYELSQRIIAGSPNSMFSEAYNLSYTDVYDFASAGNKKSLKKFEIELGIHHQELGLKWNEPVDLSLWLSVADYCANDVIATEAVFNHLSGDYIARKILAELSGMSINDTTNAHSTKIIFGDDPKPQSQAIYTDLSTIFPGYEFKNGKSSYRGEDPSEGGYVYSVPGMYFNVAVLDVASMHPTSMEELNLFGTRYTKRFSQLKHGRLFIKHEDYKSLQNILDGKLVPFMSKIESGEISPKDLSNALKTVINSIYGLTSAKFENKFRDPRNIDNIVAKRGSLFMIDLKLKMQSIGSNVCHIKTDSIKLANAIPEDIERVMSFGKQYGYDFEHETTYEKFCLVNDAVYIAKIKDGKDAGKWTATGTQFAQPYVFKTLFSKEPIEFKDLCETKSVSTAIYLDMNEFLGDEHDYHFVGKVGSFCPIKPGCGGGVLLREKDDKYHALSGTKGYRWLEAEMVKKLGKEDDIDHSYYRVLVDEAVKDISKYGDFEWFVSDDQSEDKSLSMVPCGDKKYDSCYDCPVCETKESGMAICKLGFEIVPF
jgi:energy-coupling factor transporter ATP-binding protein EcfA2